MPAEFPAVDGFPEEYRKRTHRDDYRDIEQRLKSQPANEVRVVAAGMTKSEAGNLRSWLDGRNGIHARTTSRRGQLERYSAQLKAQGIDFTKLKAPNNHIVLALYSDSDQS